MKKRIVGLETEYGILPFDEKDDKGMFEILAENLQGEFLPNGGLVYVEVLSNFPSTHGKVDGNRAAHPEYATPEILIPDSLKELIAYDKAGELILSRKLPGLRLFKNSEDEVEGSRTSFGCHENYSLHTGGLNSEGFRKIDRWLNRLEPFFIARQAIHGSGSIVNGKYHLSQKAKFLYESFFQVKDIGNGSLSDRYSRMHVSSTDSNMCEMATYLKVGLTALMLDLLEEGKLPDIVLDESEKDYNYSIPFHRLHEWRLDVLLNGKSKKMGVFEILDAYIEKAMRYDGGDDVSNNVLRKTAYALDCLKREPMELKGWLDWIEKKRLLDMFMEADGLSLENNLVKCNALQYHDIGRRAGWFYDLRYSGKIEEVVTSEEVLKAVSNPPRNTRAWFRGNVMGRWGERVHHVDWGRIVFILGELGSYKTGSCHLSTDDPFNSYDAKLSELEGMMAGYES